MICDTQIHLQLATEADLGLAGAYINGDFSFVDKTEGLLNMAMVKLMAYCFYSSIFFLCFHIKVC